MAITIDDFSKIWASTSPLTPYSFSDANYKEGWNFVGATPPSRQMWDFLQKNNDEKMQYLANNYLPLSGGTMTGEGTIKYSGKNNRTAQILLDIDATNFDVGWNFPTTDGAVLGLRGVEYSNPSTDAGSFLLAARKGNDSSTLAGYPTGELFWNNVSLTDGTFLTARIVSTGTNPTNGSNVTAPDVSGYQFVCWVMTASQGSTVASYIQNATSNPGRIWYVGSASGVYFDCTALYVRKW